MPSGGSGYYPGVDPDGLNPGGLSVAGIVAASGFKLNGIDSKAIYGYFGRYNTDVVAAHGTTTNISLDTTNVATGGIAKAGNNSGVIVPADRLYLGIATVNNDSATPASGTAQAQFPGGIATGAFVLNSIGASDGLLSSTIVGLFDSTGGPLTIVCGCFNGTPADINIELDFLIFSLGPS